MLGSPSTVLRPIRSGPPLIQCMCLMSSTAGYYVTEAIGRPARPRGCDGVRAAPADVVWPRVFLRPRSPRTGNHTPSSPSSRPVCLRPCVPLPARPLLAAVAPLSPATPASCVCRSRSRVASPRDDFRRGASKRYVGRRNQKLSRERYANSVAVQCPCSISPSS